MDILAEKLTRFKQIEKSKELKQMINNLKWINSEPKPTTPQSETTDDGPPESLPLPLP